MNNPEPLIIPKRQRQEIQLDYFAAIPAVQQKLSRSKASKRQRIFVLCSDEYQDQVRMILTEHQIEVNFDLMELDRFEGEVICYYHHGSLDYEQQELIVTSLEKGAWIEPLESYLDSRLGYMELRLLENAYFIDHHVFSAVSNPASQRLKRALDVAFALMLGLVTLPVLLLTAMLIKLDSPGPVFFRQKRVGQYNKEFDVIKFRSMCQNAEKNGAVWAAANDARITRIGNFIRKTRIDEIPQIINVIKGDMSMVGPRPERDVFIQRLEEEIPYYRFRHAVKPGITGLAQVSYPYGASVEDAVWKHKYDLLYIKHYSFWSDCVILLQTVGTVLKGLGR